MLEKDLQISKRILKDKIKNPLFRCFVASKRGGNARGKGENRSVILATQDGKEWYQYAKIWGNRNEERAKEIIDSKQSN